MSDLDDKLRAAYLLGYDSGRFSITKHAREASCIALGVVLGCLIGGAVIGALLTPTQEPQRSAWVKP